MKVLLTGSSGFVGQNLGPFLSKQDFEVLSLSLHGNWQQNLPERYDTIIHLAGKAHDTKNASSSKEYFRVNTNLTKRLFEKFLQSNARNFIYFSSVKAAADTVEG